MISLPTKGFAVSVKVHNVDRYILCDWIEASALFLGDEVSGSDIVDVLLENNVYKSQDFAWEIVNDALSILELRGRLIGQGYPFQINHDSVEPKGEWQDFSPYSFCLMLSLAKSHSSWIRDNFGANYTEQGELFELLTAEAVKLTFAGWKVHTTGWTRSNTVAIKNVVRDICSQLNEAAGDVLRWTKATAKEAGLDLVSWRPFIDGNVGVPVYLWQCASGLDWQSKRKTPDIAIWNRIVTWAVTPRRAMSMPFALSDIDLRQHSVAVEGLLLDRHRLLEPGVEQRDWITDDLRARLIGWLTPRIAVLPLLDSAV